MPPFDFVGPYELGDKLGQGGMGSVYRAVHVKTKDPVAVKIIAAQVADEPRFRRRFDAEVKTLMSLQHPGIVKLIGFGEEHGQLFYSMELVEGDSLQALIKREKKLSWKQSIDFAIEICTALKHAHDVGVIHRDLKPANLIVTSDHNVKLVDFGIAKIFGDQQQTVVGSMLGTLDYMAPEQVDSESITVRTDLYAVGSVLYCMLTGRPPFRGKNATQVLDMLKNQPPARLDLIDPDLPETLVELVHELLAKSPAQRPPTALSVAKRLKAMRAGLEKMDFDTKTQGPTSSEEKTSVTLQGHDATQVTSPTNVLATDYLPPGLSSGEKLSQTDLTRDAQVSGTLASEELTLMGASEIAQVHEGTGSSLAAAGNPALQTLHEKTVETSTDSSDGSAHSSELQTHFQEADSTRRNVRAQETTTTQANRWTQRIGLAAMILVLFAAVLLVGNAMKPPTSDELHAQAMGAGGAGAQRSFIKNFPDDPRRVAVEDRLMLNQLDSAKKRISAQRQIGVKQLSPAELAFLSLFDDSSLTSVDEQSRALEGWLVAFEGDEPDQEVRTLMNLIRYEADRLKEKRPDPRIDQRLADLLEKIESVMGDGTAEQQRQKLESLIELFKQEDWASPAIERANQLRRTLTSETEE